MKKIIEKIFGYKYYAILVDYMGSDSLSAQVYKAKKDACIAAKQLQEDRNQYRLHVISFRSHRELVPENIKRNHVTYARGDEGKGY